MLPVTINEVMGIPEKKIPGVINLLVYTLSLIFLDFVVQYIIGVFSFSVSVFFSFRKE